IQNRASSCKTNFHHLKGRTTSFKIPLHRIKTSLHISLLVFFISTTTLHAQLDQTDMAADLNEALTFTKYPTYAQYDSVMHYFADSYPEICRIDTFGTSIQGRLLLAVKISDNPNTDEDEPAFLYTSTMHGDELVGYVLSLRLIDFILSNYGADPEIDRIVDELEIWINPLSNPDGAYYHDGDTTNRDTTVAYSRRYNLNGTDLNRDFPEVPDANPEDLSSVEPENIHMIRFLEKHRFNLSANMHSGAEVVNYPWDYTYTLHPDDDWYRFISREYADGVHAVEPNYMLGFDNGITNGAVWYIITGGRQDFVNYFLHGREVTLELSDIKKLPSELLDPYWSYNQWSLINYISQARYGVHGKVTCRRTGVPAPAEIRVMDHDSNNSWVRSDSVYGSFYRYLKEGVYDLLVSAEGFVSDTVWSVAVYDHQRTELLVELDSLGTGDRGMALQQAFVCFPNPATEVLHLRGSKPFEPGAQLEVFAVSGARVLTEALRQGTQLHRIDVSGMEQGVYLLRIRNGREVFNLRFVKQ
ncbi:MAG: M14 family zinc carboxypeptidase, partial [Bacteroidales bacterium]